MSHYHDGRLAEPFMAGGYEYYLHWRGCGYLVIEWDAGRWDAFAFDDGGLLWSREVEGALERGGAACERVRRGLEPWDAGHERLWQDAAAQQ